MSKTELATPQETVLAALSSGTTESIVFETPARGSMEYSALASWCEANAQDAKSQNPEVLLEIVQRFNDEAAESGSSYIRMLFRMGEIVNTVERLYGNRNNKNKVKDGKSGKEIAATNYVANLLIDAPNASHMRAAKRIALLVSQEQLNELLAMRSRTGNKSRRVDNRFFRSVALPMGDKDLESKAAHEDLEVAEREMRAYQEKMGSDNGKEAKKRLTEFAKEVESKKERLRKAKDDLFLRVKQAAQQFLDSDLSAGRPMIVLSQAGAAGPDGPQEDVPSFTSPKTNLEKAEVIHSKLTRATKQLRGFAEQLNDLSTEDMEHSQAPRIIEETRAVFSEFQAAMDELGDAIASNEALLSRKERDAEATIDAEIEDKEEGKIDKEDVVILPPTSQQRAEKRSEKRAEEVVIQLAEKAWEIRGSAADFQKFLEAVSEQYGDEVERKVRLEVKGRADAAAVEAKAAKPEKGAKKEKDRPQEAAPTPVPAAVKAARPIVAKRKSKADAAAADEAPEHAEEEADPSPPKAKEIKEAAPVPRKATVAPPALGKPVIQHAIHEWVRRNMGFDWLFGPGGERLQLKLQGIHESIIADRVDKIIPYENRNAVEGQWEEIQITCAAKVGSFHITVLRGGQTISMRTSNDALREIREALSIPIPPKAEKATA